MNLIKNWNKFLINEEFLPYDNKRLSDEEVIEIIKDKCSYFIDVIKEDDPKNKLIFRKYREYLPGNFLVNPKKSENLRIAPNANTNYHNLLLSNLPSWQDYPIRNRSLICAGFYRAHHHFGFYDKNSRRDSLKVVIPFDSTKIAVATTSDIWDSFESRGVDSLPSWVYNKIERLSSDFGINIPGDIDWNEFKSFLEKTDSLKFFDDKLNPEGLFHLGYFNQISNIIDKYKTDNNSPEVWLEDECLLVDYSTIFDISGDIRYDTDLNSNFLDKL